MAEYNISQRPKKAAKTGPKKFWAPKLQKQKLNQKNVLTFLVAGGVIIVIGAVFVAIKFTSQKTAPKSPTAPTITGSGTYNPTQHGVTAAENQAVKSAVASKNATLLNSYFALKVKIVVIDSNINEIVDADQAAKLINDGLAGTQNPWNFNVPYSDIQNWQNGPYGQYFSGDVVVGISANGDVISVGFDNNGQIDSVFIAPSSVLGSGSSTSSSNTGSGTGSAPQVPSAAAAQD